MAPRSECSGALVGAAGAGVTVKAGELNVNQPHYTFDRELLIALRLDRLGKRHGLRGSHATLAAMLAYDGGRAR